MVIKDNKLTVLHVLNCPILPYKMIVGYARPLLGKAGLEFVLRGENTNFAGDGTTAFSK